MGKCIIPRKGSINSKINFNKWGHTTGTSGWNIDKDGWAGIFKDRYSYVGVDKPFVYKKSFEITINFILTSLPTRASTLFGSSVLNAFYKAPSFELKIDGLWAGFSYNGTTWDENINYQFEWETDKEYYLKYSYDADSKILKLEMSYNGVNWDEVSEITDVDTGYQCTSNEYLEIGGVAQSVNHYFSCGKINIFKSYIKTDETLFWGIVHENKSSNFNELVTDGLEFVINSKFSNFKTPIQLGNPSDYGITTGIAPRTVEIINTCGSADNFMICFGYGGNGNGKIFALTQTEFVGYYNALSYGTMEQAMGKTRYICCISYQKNMTIYVNGIKVAEKVMDYNVDPTDDYFSLNTFNNNNTPIVSEGCITHEIRIYNRLLNEAEIMNNYTIYNSKYNLS